MSPRKIGSQVAIVALGLLLLGALGAVWPTLVAAQAPDRTAPPAATVGDAIGYQGYLTDSGGDPLDGTFTMRFLIYNAPVAGTLLWDSGAFSVTVDEGLFDVRFDIPLDIFNGEELWVAQRVGGELLSPRQEILPAPMAHTLRPGAIVKGTANAIPNNYILDIQMNNNAFAFNRGAITGQSTTGNAIYGLANNGRALYGQTQDGYAVYGFDGGSDPNRGYAGYFYSTNGIGVYGYSNANRAHPNIYAPGVYGQSNQGVGVYGRGDTSNSNSFYNEGGRFEGGKGLFARGMDSNTEFGYGAQIYSDNYRGMYVQADNNWFDAYFGGDTGISTNGIVDRSFAAQALVVNGGKTSIRPGDLVAMIGVVPSPENDQPMLAVERADASNRGAVVGVATSAMEARTLAHEDGRPYVDFTHAAGPAAPGDYLAIITEGLAPAVNVGDLPALAGAEIGARVALSSTGDLMILLRRGDDLVLGRVAGELDPASGTIPLLIDID